MLVSQVSYGFILLWLRHILRVDEQFHPETTFQTRSRHRLHQRFLAARKYRRVVHLAYDVGAHLS